MYPGYQVVHSFSGILTVSKLPEALLETQIYRIRDVASTFKGLQALEETNPQTVGSQCGVVMDNSLK